MGFTLWTNFNQIRIFYLSFFVIYVVLLKQETLNSCLFSMLNRATHVASILLKHLKKKNYNQTSKVLTNLQINFKFNFLLKLYNFWIVSM